MVLQTESDTKVEKIALHSGVSGKNLSSLSVPSILVTRADAHLDGTNVCIS